MIEAVGPVTTVLRNAAPAVDERRSATAPRRKPHGKVQAMTDTPPSSGPGPQKPKADRAAPSPTEAYVRLELHSANGRFSVIGSNEVPGPLSIPSAVIHGLAYEVLLDDRQIALGSIPDVGLRRAFANRDVPGPEGKHRFIQVPAFDFFVRIPKAHVSDANLPKLTIVLHNVRQAPDRLVPATALQRQSGIETTEVARLSGLSLEKLPPAVRPLFEKALQDNKPPQQ